ncbi:MAG: hypothetical protein MUC65_08105 [Pontiellaceae bacterium]|nr:hypothetical protein [Pontiellaceae bacterium]
MVELSLRPMSTRYEEYRSSRWTSHLFFMFFFSPATRWTTGKSKLYCGPNARI